MKIEKIDRTIDSVELLPEIVNRIFSICKVDPTFQLKDEIEIIENNILVLKKKIEKQNLLIEKSEELKKDILQRLEILENYNQRKQTELIESIGE